MADPSPPIAIPPAAEPEPEAATSAGVAGAGGENGVVAWSPELINCAVIGGGYLGSRIAAELALCGCTVKIYDRSLGQRVVQKVAEAISELERTTGTTGALLLQQGEEETLATVEGGAGGSYGLRTARSVAALRRVITCESLADAARGCNLISEAIVDDPRAKVSVFREVLEHCAGGAVLTTNSLNVTLDEIKPNLPEAWQRRVLGLRFLSPVLYIPLVEVTYAAESQAAEKDLVVAMMESLGKIVFDCPVMEHALKAPERVVPRGGEAGQPVRPPLPYLGWSRLRLNSGEALHHQTREARRHEQVANGSTESGSPVPEAELCAVCLTAPRNAMSITCGHAVMCSECATKVQMMTSSCPFCRVRMREVVLTKQGSTGTY
jgi:hypothetical protein